MVTTSISSLQTSSYWPRTRHSGTPLESSHKCPGSDRCGSGGVCRPCLSPAPAFRRRQAPPRGCGRMRRRALALQAEEARGPRHSLGETSRRAKHWSGRRALLVARYCALAEAVATWAHRGGTVYASGTAFASSAESFSLLSAGIDEHRAAASTQEPKRYRVAAKKFTEALKVDREKSPRSSTCLSSTLAGMASSRSRFRSSNAPAPSSSVGTWSRRRLERRSQSAPSWQTQRGTGSATDSHRSSCTPAGSRTRSATCGADRLDVRRSHGVGWRWTGRQPTWSPNWYKRAPARL